MSDIFREYFHKVESRDVDFMKKATIMALGDYILNTAGEDADLHGVGVRDLNAKSNSSWVLIRMAVEVDRIPVEHEQLRITTWVSEVGRVMTTRNFEVFDADGKRIAASVTNWAMINVTTRRPMDLHSLEGYDEITQHIAPPCEEPRKLGVPANAEVSTHRVVYSDIDFNGHTNSMKYLQWVVDTLSLEDIEHKRFARVDINFIHETRYGEQLNVAAGDDGLFEVTDAEGRAVCRIGVEMI